MNGVPEMVENAPSRQMKLSQAGLARVKNCVNAGVRDSSGGR
jgi:hypothetical protein